MKKLLTFIFTVVIILAMSITSFASSVPEDLLHEDQSKVFLGTVENYTTKDIPASPYKKITSIEVIPTEKIKGDIELGKKVTYKNSYNILDFEPDTEYLFGYFDENSYYIFEIESRENGIFKIKDSEKFDSDKYLEDCLNDGSFEKAEKERQERLEKAEQEAQAKIKAENQKKQHEKFKKTVFTAVGVGTLIVVLIVLILVMKKRK